MTKYQIQMRTRRHARIRRVKQLLRWMPRKATLERYPVLKWFAKSARQRPYLWSFKVKHCTPAFYAGSIISFLPLYGSQLLFAFLAALLFRANLPITGALQFITNPFTMVPLYYLTYRVGRWIIEFTGYGEGINRVATNVNALMIGGVIVGAFVGAVLDVAYRIAAYEARKFKLAPLKKQLDAATKAAAAGKSAVNVKEDTENPPLAP